MDPLLSLEHPWMVSIFFFDPRLQIGSHHCGGFLVDEYHITSAAHCFFSGSKPLKPINFEVYVGAYDLKHLNAPYKVEKIY